MFLPRDKAYFVNIVCQLIWHDSHNFVFLMNIQGKAERWGGCSDNELAYFNLSVELSQKTYCNL
jgi:hypothetical protein